MKLALGVMFMWMGAALLYIASHGLPVTTPWEAFKHITGRISENAAT